MTMEDMHARYDFSLLSLSRAWSSPWTPQNHMSFQPEMRIAIKTVVMSTHRLGMPLETAFKISSFLNRGWWGDSRRECWNDDCKVNDITKAINQYSDAIEKNDNNGPSRPIQFADFLSQASSRTTAWKVCSVCNVPKYCSKTCKIESYKASHKRCCNKPPCCKGVPTLPEIQLYRDVFACSGDQRLRTLHLPQFIKRLEEKTESQLKANQTDVKMLTYSTNDVVDSNVDENDPDEETGSWESMDSDDDDDDGGDDDDCNNENGTKATMLIHNFFKKYSYEA